MSALPDPFEDLASLLPYMTDEDRARYDAIIPPAPPSFCDPKFPYQSAFIRDPARFKALIGPRRMGKSNTISRQICERGMLYPGGRQGGMSLYIGLTSKQARLSFWDPALKPVLRDAGMLADCKINEQEMICRLPNGHVIYVMGMESADAIKDRVRGGGCATIAVDEGATFMLSLDGIMSNVLRPAVADVLGTLLVAGTPGFVRIGLFYRLTSANNEPRPAQWTVTDRETASEWAIHRWTGAENPYMAEQLAVEVAAMLAANPQVERLPWFLRESRGLWVLDDSKLCYRYAPDRNDYTKLPDLPAGQWHHLLVCDMGYRPDPLAMTVMSWNDMDPAKVLYVQRCTERLGLLDHHIVALVREREAVFRFDSYVIDGAELRAVEDMRQRSAIPWIAADKRGKSDFIELLNSDLLLGRIKIHTEDCRWEAAETIKCASLAEELLGLVWDEKALAKGMRVEDGACAQHGVDTLLYGWRHAYVYMNRGEPPPRPPPGSAEAYALEEKRLEEAAVRHWQREQVNPEEREYEWD